MIVSYKNNTVLLLSAVLFCIDAVVSCAAKRRFADSERVYGGMTRALYGSEIHRRHKLLLPLENCQL